MADMRNYREFVAPVADITRSLWSVRDHSQGAFLTADSAKVVAHALLRAASPLLATLASGMVSPTQDVSG